MSFLNNLIDKHTTLNKNDKLKNYLALDTETTGLELNHGCKPFFISTCDTNGKTKYWHWPIDPLTRQPKIPKSHLKEVIKHVSNKVLVFHNANFDLQALRTVGLNIRFKRDKFQTRPFFPHTANCISFHDTVLASHAIRSSDSHKLKPLALQYLDYSDLDERTLKEKTAIACRKARKEHPNWRLGYDLKGDRQTGADTWVPHALDPSDTSLQEYACGDVERTILLWKFFLEQFAKPEFESNYKCYLREKILLPTFFRQQSQGITVNTLTLNATERQLEKSIALHRSKAIRIGKQYLGKDFNPESGDQTRKLLYDVFNLPILKYTKANKPSTNRDTLEKLLVETHGSSIFKPRKYIKEILLSRVHQSSLRYLQAYSRYALPTELPSHAKLYSSINQTGTSTTRVSMSNPNGQNISGQKVRDVAGIELEVPSLRQIFAPPPGKVWYSIDYSQLELRIFSVVANDEKLMAAFDRGEDIHNFVAENMFNKIGKANISKEQRTIAKMVNFRITYGAGERSTDQAAGFPGAYKLFVKNFESLPRLKKSLIARAKQYGYVETLFNYQLDIPQDRVATTVIDYVCQGTAGDIIKNAAIAIDQKGIVDWEHSSILLQVHDELLFEVDDHPKYNNELFVKSLVREMKNAGKELGVHTPVEVKLITKDWSEGETIYIK